MARNAPGFRYPFGCYSFTMFFGYRYNVNVYVYEAYIVVSWCQLVNVGGKLMKKIIPNNSSQISTINEIHYQLVMFDVARKITVKEKNLFSYSIIEIGTKLIYKHQSIPICLFIKKLYVTRFRYFIGE